MYIIIGILQSFFSAISMILQKKVAENKKIGNNWQTLFSKLNNFIILGFFIYFSSFGLEFKINPNDLNIFNISIFIGSVILLYSTYPLRIKAYANEKVSVLQPFTMLSQVFPIIIGFIFISSERVNIYTFIIALIASTIVILTSIDYKNFKINKYSLMILVSSIIKSIQIFALIYLLTILSPETLYSIESIAIIIISSLLIFVKKEFNELKLISKKYFQLLMTTSTIALIATILIFKMYTSMGIILTSLLTLAYLAFVYLFGYIILKEIPSKKDISVTFAVVVCIILGLYFKS